MVIKIHKAGDLEYCHPKGSWLVAAAALLCVAVELLGCITNNNPVIAAGVLTLLSVVSTIKIWPFVSSMFQASRELSMQKRPQRFYLLQTDVVVHNNKIVAMDRAVAAIPDSAIVHIFEKSMFSTAYVEFTDDHDRVMFMLSR